MLNLEQIKKKYQWNAYYYDFVTQAFSGSKTFWVPCGCRNTCRGARMSPSV